MVNVLHFSAPDMLPAAVGSMINGAVNAGMWAVMANFHKVIALDITPLFDNGATYTYLTDGSAKWTGSAGSADVIPNTAAVVSFKTVERGAANRGRAYIGGVAEASLVNGLIDGAKKATMVSGWNTFGGSVITAGAEHVVASYKNKTALTVVNYSIRDAAGTQRRRQSRLAL